MRGDFDEDEYEDEGTCESCGMPLGDGEGRYTDDEVFLCRPCYAAVPLSPAHKLKLAGGQPESQPSPLPETPTSKCRFCGIEIVLFEDKWSTPTGNCWCYSVIGNRAHEPEPAETRERPAEPTEPPEWNGWLVLRKKDIEPWEVYPFERYDQAAVMFDRLQMGWSETYFCRVAFGPGKPISNVQPPPSSPALTALVEKWRQRADDSFGPEAPPTPMEAVRFFHVKAQADATRRCADELETALRSSASRDQGETTTNQCQQVYQWMGCDDPPVRCRLTDGHAGYHEGHAEFVRWWTPLKEADAQAETSTN